MKQRALVHLHPDFKEPLKSLLHRWNDVQQAMEFAGLQPGRAVERDLLSRGAISNAKASKIAGNLRRDAGYPPDVGITIFTEKRVYDNQNYQLFVGGRSSDEDPPSVAVLSLEFLRRDYTDGGIETPILFRAIVSNVLYAIGIDLGLSNHEESHNCIMDYCENMLEIEKGLLRGPKFCASHARSLGSSPNSFLLDLARAARDFKDLEHTDSEVTEAIVLRGKRYDDKSSRFNYDVALSYAGQDSAQAKLLAVELQRRHLKVFFAEFDQANLWGKNLQTHLPELYRLRAKFCVVFQSSHYSASRWTRMELEAALQREIDEGHEYVLPIKLDPAGVEGISPAKVYVEWHDETVKSIGDLVVKKLKQSAKLDDKADRPSVE